MNSPDFSFLFNYQRGSLTMILSAMIIGILIGSVAMIYRQRFLGGIVRKLISMNAFDESSAVTVEEMGYNAKNHFVKFALRNKSTFAKTVHRTAEETPKYFIPREIKDREEIRYRKKGSDGITLAIGLIVFLAAGYALLTVIPWFKDALSNIFS